MRNFDTPKSRIFPRDAVLKKETQDGKDPATSTPPATLLAAYMAYGLVDVPRHPCALAPTAAFPIRDLAPSQLALEVPFPWNVLPQIWGRPSCHVSCSALPEDLVLSPPVLSALCHSRADEDRKRGGLGRRPGGSPCAPRADFMSESDRIGFMC